MADLPYIQRDGEVKIVGQDSTGDTVNYVSADVNGNLLTKDYADGPVTPGTVASVSQLMGGQFNSTPPAPTNGQQLAIQLSENGTLIQTEEERWFNSQSKVYSAISTTINVGTTETPFYLLRNPSGSGKTLKIFKANMTGSGTFKLYYLPTVTANGTTIAPLLRKVTSGAQGNVGLATSSPTTTSNGSLADLLTVSAQVGTGLIEFTSFIILPANTSLLVTATMGANNTPTTVELEWAEI